MAYGVTNEGFTLKRLEDILLSLSQSYVAAFGAIDTDPESVAGQQIGAVSKQLADTWEQMEKVYYSQYPRSASGVPLDNAVSLTGIERLPATPTQVIVAVFGTESTAVIAETLRVSTSQTSDQYDLSEDITITKSNIHAATVEVVTATPSLLYEIDLTIPTFDVNGAFVTNKAVTGAYTAGGGDTTSDIAEGLRLNLLTDSDIVNGFDLSRTDAELTIQLDSQFADSSNISFSLDSVTSPEITINEFGTPGTFLNIVSGAVVAPVGAIDTIETPLSGVDRVSNFSQGQTGRDIETDTALRIRQQQSLQVVGVATVEAIKAKLELVENVSSVSVFENETDITDGAGRPPHSVHAVISGGADQDIADTLFATKAAGIQTFGSESETVIDSSGTTHVVYWDRPTNRYIYLVIEYEKNPEEAFPVDGESLIRSNVLDYHQNEYQLGEDVILQKYHTPIYAVPGIQEVKIWAYTSLSSGDTPSFPGAYSTTNLVVISSTEVSVLLDQSTTLIISEGITP